MIQEKYLDTKTVIAVVAGEAEKARLIELTKDAIIVAPPSMPFDVRSVKLPITKLDILEAIRESRERY